LDAKSNKNAERLFSIPAFGLSRRRRRNTSRWRRWARAHNQKHKRVEERLWRRSSTRLN